MFQFVDSILKFSTINQKQVAEANYIPENVTFYKLDLILLTEVSLQLPPIKNYM